MCILNTAPDRDGAKRPHLVYVADILTQILLSPTQLTQCVVFLIEEGYHLMKRFRDLFWCAGLASSL